MEIIGIGILFMIGIYLVPVVITCVLGALFLVGSFISSLFGSKKWTKLKTQTQNIMNYGTI